MKDKRELELVNSFKDYLEILIKDFSDIDYDNVKKRGGYIDGGIVRFYRVIISQLVSRLKDIKSKVTVADILRYSTIEDFDPHDPVIIPMKDRFQQIKLCDRNLHDFRNRPLELGNNYTITGQGAPDHFNIIIQNKAITSPRLKDDNPGCAVLFYRFEKLESSNGKSYYEHSVFIKHPLANLNFIKHYIANLHFIKRYEGSGSELVEKYLDEKKYEDVETHTPDVEEESDDNIVACESENAETVQSDNNKTLNFSFPGPNGSKISINLSINISFDQ